jgi:hypothetical protein
MSWGRPEVDALTGRMARRLEYARAWGDGPGAHELADRLIDYQEREQSGRDGRGETNQTTWAPVDLAPILDGEEVDEPPTQLERIDGTCLLYLGKLHAVHGEPETAKGWLLLHAAAEEINKGEDFCGAGARHRPR